MTLTSKPSSSDAASATRRDKTYTPWLKFAVLKTAIFLEAAAIFSFWISECPVVATRSFSLFPTQYSSTSESAAGVEKSTTGETWLINATFGTLSDKTFNVSFVSNDTEYSQFWIGLRMGDYQIRYDDTLVFDADGAVWQNQAYRTIGLYEPASGDFLTWLNANAVKQS